MGKHLALRHAVRTCAAAAVLLGAWIVCPAFGASLAPGSPAAAGEARTGSGAQLAGGRIPIETAHVRGSLALSGARLDDLYLKDHYTTVDATSARDASQQVELLRPADSDGAFYAGVDWVSDSGAAVTGSDTPWRLIAGGVLTPQTPVTLEYEAAGLGFRRVVSVDDQYMFTIADTVTNRSAAVVALGMDARVTRDGLPETYRPGVVHEGSVGVAGNRLLTRRYGALAEGKTRQRTGEGGWTGITDKYWLAAVIPPQDATIEVTQRAIENAGDEYSAIYESGFRTAPAALEPGASLAVTMHVFAGAKEYDVLQAYKRDLGIHRFLDAIDWGNFWFLTRPFFWSLEHIDSVVGNFGAAILIFTVALKLAFFPITDRAYSGAARTQKLQPRVRALQQQYKGDRDKLHEEMTALYKAEGVNPMAGCLPLLIQIPVLFALYKTLAVTIEMRHEPFVGWVRDLSERDPTMIGNLFGLLPWDPAAVPVIGPLILAIGLWPVIMGLSMWAMQALTPPPERSQAWLIAALPLVFTILLASFPVGLVIYWTWNNVLSVAQQYAVSRRMGVETPFDRMLRSRR